MSDWKSRSVAVNQEFQPPPKSDWKSRSKAVDPAQPAPQAVGVTDGPTPASRGSQAVMEGVGQGASLGYLPQLQAMAEPALAKVYDAITGENISDDTSDSFSDRTKSWEEHQHKLKTENPLSYGAGEVYGGVASALAPGAIAARTAKGAALSARMAAAMKNATIPGRAAMAMSEAGAYGAASNPGEQSADESPFQLQKRLENAKHFASFAGVVPVGAEASAPLVKAFAETQAFKSLGPYARAAVNAVKRGAKTTEENGLADLVPGQSIGGVRDVGRAALDNDVIPSVVPTGFKGLSERAGKAQKSAGDNLGGVLDDLGSAEERLRAKAPGANMGIDRKAIADNLRERLIKADHADVPAVKAANKKYEELISQFENGGDQHIPILQAEMKKRAASEGVNYSKAPADMTPDELFHKELATRLKTGVEDTADVLDKTVNGPSAENFIKAKNNYGNAKAAKDITDKRFAHELAKTVTSAGFGAATGGAAGIASGHDMESRIKNAILGTAGGLVMGTGLRAGRLYGPQVLARQGDRLADALPIVAQVASRNPWLAPAAIKPFTGDDKNGR